MANVAIILLADTKTHGDLGRAVNALEVAREFKEAGDEVAIVLDGAGVRWVPEFENPEHPKHELWLSVKDKLAGACSFCSAAFHVKDKVEAADIKLLAGFDDHPSLRNYVINGYQVITF